MKRGFIKAGLSAACVAAVLWAATSAQAVQFTFYRLTSNGGLVNPEGQLFADVTPNGNLVDFKISNAGPIASSICDIYFDDGTLLDLASINWGSQTGVSFDDPATPGDLPSGNTASPPFVTTQDFSADSNSPHLEANGVNPGEWVTITFSLQNVQTFDDTIAALNDGSLRIGLHVQAIGTAGESDSFLNNGGGKFPDGGATVGLLGCALTALGLVGRRLRKA